jgi:hypothetical protein
MLWRFRGFIEEDLACKGDLHTLQPGADREAAVQGEPNEGAHLVRAGAVPNFGQHLGVRAVVELQLLDERANDRDFSHSPRVPIAPLGRVPKEKQVFQWGRPLLVPFSRVPGWAFDETGLKDPEKRGFGEHKEVFDHLERGSVLFLDKDFDQVVVLGKEGHLLRTHGSDEVVGGSPIEFYGLDQVNGDFSYLVYPLKRGMVAYSLNTDLVVGLETIGKCCWVLRDAGNDGVPVYSIDDVGVHLENREAFPFLILSGP